MPERSMEEMHHINFDHVLPTLAVWPQELSPYHPKLGVQFEKLIHMQQLGIIVWC